MSHTLPPVSEKDSKDPLSKMRAYTLARELMEVVRIDAERLQANPLTEKMAGQLYAAVGSIAANIAEGCSRSSGKDRARIFEYSLGSVRESMIWYHHGELVLGPLAQGRLDKLEEIRRMLLVIIPRERGKLIRPKL
jgi:four helix bundle protein